MKMRIQQFIAKLSVPRQGGVKDRLVFGDISVAVGPCRPPPTQGLGADGHAHRGNGLSAFQTRKLRSAFGETAIQRPQGPDCNPVRPC